MTNPFNKYLTVEDTEHIRVVNFMKDKLPNVICFHVPNEGNKTTFERFKHALMGNKKGVPDFVILHPKYKIKEEDGKKYNTLVYHGLLIELKAQTHNRIVKKGKDAGKIVKSTGKLSPEQAKLIEELNAIKYKAVCCWGSDDAINIIKEYFDLKK